MEALLNEMFENPRSKTTFRALMYKIIPPASCASMRSPIHVEIAPFKKGIKSDDPLKMLIYFISVILPSPPPIWMKHTFWIHQGVDSVEIEFLPELEGQKDHTNLSSTDVFSGHYDYKLFLLQKRLIHKMAI